MSNSSSPTAMTPEALLAHIEKCVTFYCDERFVDEIALREEAIAYLRALAAPKETAQEPESLGSYMLERD